MEKKNTHNCPHCGAPSIMIRIFGTNRLFKCDYCGQNWEPTGSGYSSSVGATRCDNCGQYNGLDARVCQKCGTQLRKVCPNCGRLIELDASFCPYCEIHITDFLAGKLKQKIKAVQHDIADIQNTIEEKNTEIKNKEVDIANLHKSIALIEKTGRKVFFFGRMGLSEEETNIYEYLSSNLGCLIKGVSFAVGIVVFSFSWQLILAMVGQKYNNFDPNTVFKNSDGSDLLGIAFLVTVAAIVIGRFAALVVLSLARSGKKDELITVKQDELKIEDQKMQELKGNLESLYSNIEDSNEDLKLLQQQVGDINSI